MSQYEPLRRCVDDHDVPPPKPPRLDLHMPAMPPLGLIHAIDHWWWAYRRRRQFRQRFLPLLAHDDHILEDMGHRRDDILWASRLPLKVDALRALVERRAQVREFPPRTG
ncbi:hypothetical protein [Halomonas faecis]|uniref:hypothetical protein n=1 Tax=Halomonas faecis TaxID=1562110 RepID=UPI0013D80D87|nr:hypothetical protein [Halomonas faecis]